MRTRFVSMQLSVKLERTGMYLVVKVVECAVRRVVSVVGCLPSWNQLMAVLEWVLPWLGPRSEQGRC